MQQQLEQLKNDSLRLFKGMPVRWPREEKTGKLDPDKIVGTIKGKRAYALSGKVIAFVLDGDLYVTPNTKSAIEALRCAGYKSYEFYVPFSRGDLPQGEYLDQWEEIVQKNRPSAKSA